MKLPVDNKKFFCPNCKGTYLNLSKHIVLTQMSGGQLPKEKPFKLVDVYPLTFEPEMMWGKCFEKETVSTVVL